MAFVTALHLWRLHTGYSLNTCITYATHWKHQPHGRTRSILWRNDLLCRKMSPHGQGVLTVGQWVVTVRRGAFVMGMGILHAWVVVVAKPITWTIFSQTIHRAHQWTNHAQGRSLAKPFIGHVNSQTMHRASYWANLLQSRSLTKLFIGHVIS